MAEPNFAVFLTSDAIVDTIREPLLVLSAGLRVRRANRAFYQTFDIAPEDAEGRLIYELGDNQWDIPALRDLLEKMLPQHRAFDDFEVDHNFPSIGRRVMLLNARCIEQEGDCTETILLAMEDITERRRVEDERRELETRFTSLVRNIRDHSIFTLDPRGHITSWNREAEKILGFSEDEAIGQHFSIIFSSEDLRDGIPAFELRTALSEGRAEDERWHVRKGGEPFWALGIVTPTRDARGVHTGFSKILRDMTDRKRMEEELQLADRRKDQFLATLAHELRNPMAPLRNGLQVLRLSPDQETQEQAVETMERQLEQMMRLVDDLADISRITRNQLLLRKVRIDLGSVVQSAVEAARPQIDAGGHELTVALPPEPVYLQGDLMRLAQVFWNLLNNSAKYTEPGGRISLTAALEGRNVVVMVQDNGIGIAAESLSSVFDMFSQLDCSLARAQGGLGIGLALVKELTEAHGGSVEVLSDGISHGCTFRVSLPVSEGEASAAK